MAVDGQLREFVARRALYRCEYCHSHERFSADSFSVDHILPRARGGPTDAANLALACQGCNNHKFTATESRDPQTDEVAPIFNPREDEWSDHFAWNADLDQIEGRTPTGRATVERLRLNRPHLVNLRRVLKLAGAHQTEP